MSLAEGVSARIAYKFYASGALATNTTPDPTVSPGASGGQALRRVSSTLSLKKASYQSAEIRSDRQIADFRHGIAHVEGNISGELSPATYFDFIEAVHRDTRVAGVVLSNTDLTSVAFDSTTSTITFTGGDPVALGLRVGDPIRFTAMTPTQNDGITYTIVAFSTGNNRVLLVDPAPVTQTADTSFTLTRPGKASMVPSTGFVPRLCAFETYHSDLDISRLYLENRIGSYRLNMPATGMSTFEMTVWGRSETSFTGGAAPFFASPATETTTGVVATVDGSLLMGGIKVGVVTGIDMTLNLAPTQAEVVGQNFPAEIFLGRANLTGTLTAFLDSNAQMDHFRNEDELELIVRLTSTSDPASPVVTVYLPRIKYSAADLNLTGEAGQSISLPFQALKYTGTTPGKPNTSVRIVDSEAV